MQRSNQIATQASAMKIGEASSLSSFISVSMILLAFLVALNATRNTQVSNNTASNKKPALSNGQFLSEPNSSPKQLILREKIALSALFQDNSASFTSNCYTLATALTELIKGKGVTSMLVLDASNTIELSLQRAAALHRLLLDSGLPQEVFSIVTADAAEKSETSLTILFKEGAFDDQQ